LVPVLEKIFQKVPARATLWTAVVLALVFVIDIALLLLS
jgi:hypothetical protein